MVVELAAAHHEPRSGPVAEQVLGAVRVHPHHEPAAAAGRHGEMSVDQERQPAEHRLLGQAVLARDDRAHPLGQLLVVCHAGHYAFGV